MVENKDFTDRVFVLRIPAEFLTVDADQYHKEVVEALRESLSMCIAAGAKGIVLPNTVDENGEQMFRLEIVK